MFRENILSYIAGFFDGEGSINITVRKRKHFSLEHSLHVAIGQKDGKTLDWIVDCLGGNVSIVKRDGSYFWYCSNTQAYLFLKEIYPYLQYKKPQAEVALKFYEGKNKRTKIVSPKEIERREMLRQELKKLHKTIIKSHYAGTTTKRADPKGM